MEKQEARRRYQALHAAGKTEEAQADLARLAIIRKQREEAAKKKEEDRKGIKAKLLCHSLYFFFCQKLYMICLATSENTSSCSLNLQQEKLIKKSKI